MERVWKIIKETYAGILISLCLSFMLFFYEPLNLFASNLEDFWFDIYSFFPIALLQFSIVFLVLSISFIVIRLINKKLYSFFVVVSLIGTICTYIQGNYLVGSLPAMDGNWVDFDEFGTEKLVSLILWLVVGATLLFVLWKFKFKTYEKVAMYSSLVIITMLSSGFIPILTKNGFFDSKYNIVATYDNFYDMSSDKNLVVLLLDTVETQTFYNELEKLGKTNELFKDFTYYPDTLTGYPFTRNAIPLILSGNWYENKESYTDYLSDVYDNSKLFEELEKEDYELNLYEYNVLNEYKGNNYGRFDNLIVESKIEVDELLKDEMKMILYKYLPYQLKWRAKIDTVDLSSSRNKKYEFASRSNIRFVEKLSEQEFELEEDKNFKFIHIEGGHIPFQYDKNLNIIDNGTYEDNNDACITIVERYLNKLKDAGVYDNSAIVIMSDHGLGDGNAGTRRQNPILFVKGINEHHDFKKADTRVSLEDMVTVFLRLSEGSSATESFEGLDKEIRRHLIYDLYGSDHLEEYILSGGGTLGNTTSLNLPEKFTI